MQTLDLIEIFYRSTLLEYHYVNICQLCGAEARGVEGGACIASDRIAICEDRMIMSDT